MSTVEGDLHVDHEPDSGTAVAPFMRRAPRISQADVFQAADALLIEGHRPTIDRVRMRLGRGSPNTINDHLDAWWTKLGARLRDLPGREFPQLPERVARSLQQLWNEALDGARETLLGVLRERAQALAESEEALASRTREIVEREHATATRAAALEDSLVLAREQLAAANQRAQALERSLEERDAECSRLRARIESLEANCADARAKLDDVAAAHHAERVQLQERHAAAEQHWLLEVDRSRQLAKEAAKRHERQVGELRGQITELQSERDHFREQWVDVRSELKTAAAVREQLEERIRTIIDQKPGRAPTRSTRKRARPRKTL
jgi:DNA repair exonuclease SbcCD ATPase subunit